MPTKPNRFDFTSLRFPEELGTDEVPAYVRFTPQAVQYGGTTAIGRGAGGQFGGGNAAIQAARSGNPVQQLQNQIGGVVQNLSTAAEEQFSSITNFFNDFSIESAINAFGRSVRGSFRIGDFTLNFGQQTKADQLRSEGSISLFLPENLSTNSGVSYEATEIGAAGVAQVQAAAKASAEGRLDVGQLFSGVVEGGITDLIGQAGNLRAINAISTGKVQNPYSYQIFSGVEHRSFSYEFRMVPKTAAEALEVKRICDMFLFYMLPARSIESGLHFYDVPVQWKIEYLKQSNTLDFHQQPNACFLQSVNVTYGGETKNALHSDGSPLETTISLEFVEIEPLYREKIDGGFRGPNI